VDERRRVLVRHERCRAASTRRGFRGCRGMEWRSE
jgi:hypothetical protein